MGASFFFYFDAPITKLDPTSGLCSQLHLYLAFQGCPTIRWDMSPPSHNLDGDWPVPQRRLTNASAIFAIGQESRHSASGVQAGDLFIFILAFDIKTPSIQFNLATSPPSFQAPGSVK